MTIRVRRICGLAAMAMAMAASSGAEDWLPKGLSIHGFLTQAVAWGGDTQYFGIPADDDTASLRKAALQLRWDATPQDALVVQLSHEDWGVSAIGEARDKDVYLDWGFFQHTFDNGLWVKVGRVTIPFGVWNEVRDVGTLLPFYRLSYAVYGEGQYGVETIDGLAAGNRVSMGELELQWALYFGDAKQLQYDLETDIELDNTVGGQAWVNFPWHDLRFGMGFWQADGKNSLSGVGPELEEHYQVGVASLDGRFGPVRAIVEYSPYLYESGPYYAWSGLVQVAATDQLTINLAYETADYEYDDLWDPSLPSVHYEPYDEDLTIGVSWAFRPDLVARLEHHWYEGYTVEVPDPESDGPYEANFTILSLSASF